MSKYLLGGENNKVYLESSMLNRHTFIGGASGSGKTVSLKTVSELLAKDGIPSIIADVKGDIMSLCNPSVMNDEIKRRIELISIDDYESRAFDIEIWDVFKKGIALRTTVLEIGPVFLSTMLNLSDVQSQVMDVLFKISDAENLPLLDFKDLEIMLKYMYDFYSEISKKYGNVTRASISAIQRALIRFEAENAKDFFNEPAIDINDFLRYNEKGEGIINIINSRELFYKPTLYKTLFLYILSEIYENMPEVGDLDKPKLAIFLDEAHLLFKDSDNALLTKIETMVRLIRSKGVALFFVSQNPSDIPEAILSQVSNRIQHALRAYTPNEIKNVKYAASSFRKNKDFDSNEAILNLKTGEALTSVLDEKGEPSVAQITLIRPPMSIIGTVDEFQIKSIYENSPLYKKYKDVVDRNSAYEILSLKYEEYNKKMQEDELEKVAQKQFRDEQNKKRREETEFDKIGKVIFGSFTRQIGRDIARGILGNLKKLFR